MMSAEIVWLRHQPQHSLDDFISALNAAEKQELSRFTHPERQRSFLLSRALLRQTLAPRLQRPGSAINFTRADNGRLMLAQEQHWKFSLSHSAGLIAIVVAQAPCGIDIEIARSVNHERIAHRYFAESEQAWLAQCGTENRTHDFFRLWTLKEATVKALGEGLADNLSRLAFDISSEPQLTQPSPALALWQHTVDNIFIAAAVHTTDLVHWNIREVSLTDLQGE
jgi:4'-phosphopantetheinyl transferase